MIRRLVSFLILLTCVLPGWAAAQVPVSAVRVWPAPEYTRLTLESPQPLRYALSSATGSNRLVLHLQNAQPGSVLGSLPGRIAGNDPLVAWAEVLPAAEGVLIVLHLRAQARPQAFGLRPVGAYAHRVVLDLYPTQPADPVLALIQELEAAQPAVPSAAASPPAEEITAAATTPAAPAVGAEAQARADAGKPPAMAGSPAAKAKGGNAARKAPAKRVVTVAIDAGHGGEDPGALGRGGTREKDITLRIARKLKTLVDAEPGMRGVLIRDGDYFVALNERVNKARGARADLFVSIHADAFIKPHARGSSVFALSQRGATSAAARWLARRENEADLIGGVNLDVADPYLAQTLLDLSQDGNIRHSIKVGQAVLQELGGINDLHKPRVEQAGFAVLKAPDIPSILVETAFISNPEEEQKLRSPKHQDRMAAAILAGIKQYFADHPPVRREVLATNP
jgi:N-acetylmuramoyl-L-alanine amidase